MNTHNDPIIAHMQSLIQGWQSVGDQRAIFLSCYQMMTYNMLSAIDRHEFDDLLWVDRLLRRFAGYYFVALDSYEKDPSSAPKVWQLAHGATGSPQVLPIQMLLLGVNAHINYDLVLTLEELLRPEWDGLERDKRAARYADHCRVNEVIGRTVDAVQDQVLEPAMPVLRFFDVVLGPVDEILTSHLITQWRETVWRNAVRLLEIRVENERVQLVSEIEEDALKLGQVLA